MTQPDADTADVAALLTEAHRSASGQCLPLATAERFGLALLCALQDHCRAIGRSHGIRLGLRRVSDPDQLYLVAGDPDQGRTSYTPVPHLVRALLLREPDEPALGFTPQWQNVPLELEACAYRTLLEGRPWRRHLGLHVSFLAFTHQFTNCGLPPEEARSRAAQLLAEATTTVIVTDGILHRSPDVRGAAAHPLN